MDTLPGNTLLPFEETECITLPPFTSCDKMIVLASNDVNDHSLFLNGLTQNIVILYDLFEILGYQPYLLQHPHSVHEKREFLKAYRTITQPAMVAQQLPIYMLIEIGMSLDPLTRQYLRSIGARIVKLYLGNILNIDIENIQNCKAVFFNHHLVGEVDEIWTSPHYLQHIDYAAGINRVSLEKSCIAPYIWDPCFLTRYGTFQWTPPADWRTIDLVIMDPNISFQKCSFYSLLLAEAYSREHPEWKGNVIVINGDRLKLSTNAYNHLLANLSLYKAGRIQLLPRKKIHTILQENPSACFITHQWNNDYNYMTLELVQCQYPILHNSMGWMEYGYHYSIDNWKHAINTMHLAFSKHNENRKTYQTHAANLIWKHSIHNPNIQLRWRKILDKPL